MTKSPRKSSSTTKRTAVKLAVVASAEAAAPEPAELAAPVESPVQAAVEAPAQAKLQDAAEASPANAVLTVKKKDFLDRVAQVSGAKKQAVRDISEAVLSVLGEALSKGESLVLPPLGKLRVSKHIDKSGSEVLQVRLKRMGAQDGAEKGEKTAAAPLAAAED